MPWNSIVFDSDGKIKDARVPSGELLTASGTPSINEITALGSINADVFAAPRIAAYMIGGVNAWAEDASGGEYIREGIAKLDLVILGMNTDIIDDTTTPGGTMSRQDIVADIKSRSINDEGGDIWIFDYANGQETANTGGTTANKLYDETGPAGAAANWDTQSIGKGGQGDTPQGTDLTPTGPYASTGLPVSDWWGRDGSGFKRYTFTASTVPFTINVTTFVDTDSLGRYYPEFGVDNTIGPKQLDPFLISNGGPGYGRQGINIYIDVFDLRPLSDNIDWNGDGVNDQARSFFDAFNQVHQDDNATVIGGGVVSAGEWRGGRRSIVDILKTRYPGIAVIGNVTTWVKQNTTFGDILRDVQPEYQLVKGTSVPPTNVTPRQSIIQGGIAGENQTFNAQFPVTGVGADGVPNGLGFPGAEPGFWLAFNEYRYMVEVSDDPKLACNDFVVEAFKPRLPDVNGRKAWDWVPDDDAIWHLMRWGLGLALQDDGMFCLTPIDVGTTRTGQKQGNVICDAFGTINQATTGLSKGWLGSPVTPGPATIPVVGSGNQAILIREYENGWNVVTTSKTQSLILPVSFLGGAGATKTFPGFQDPGHDNDQVITSNLTVQKMDSYQLLKVA